MLANTLLPERRLAVPRPRPLCAAAVLLVLAVPAARAADELHDAIAAGDTARVRQLVAAGADVNAARQKGLPGIPAEVAAHAALPLHAAVTFGRHEIVPLLLDAGADPARKLPGNGRTALHCAARIGQPYLTRLLLEHKAPVGARDDQGGTALHVAAQHQWADVAEVLLDAGADPDAADDASRTPLHRAVEGNSTLAVDLLIARKADVNKADRHGRTPVHLALAQGKVALAGWLLTGAARVDTADDEGHTPLHAVLEIGDDELARTLVRLGAKGDVKDRHGATLLHHAVRVDRLSSARFALEQKIDVNAADDEGRTALHLAAGLTDGAAHRDELLLLLLAKGADLTATDAAGRTPLAVAVAAHRYPAARLLAERMKGTPAPDPLAVLDEKDDRRQRYLEVKKATAAAKAGPDGVAWLLAAARANDLATVELLAVKKGDLEARGSDGRTALAQAVENGSWVMTRLLVEAGAGLNGPDPDTGPTPLHRAAREGHAETARLLLAAGADVNLDFPDLGAGTRHTALGVAAALGDVPTVDVLLAGGADVNYRDTQQGRTPALLAAEGRRWAVVDRLLREKDVDVKARSARDVTLLHAAAADGRLDLAKRLLERGASAEALDAGGSTPLHLAARSLRTDVVRLLLRQKPDVNLQRFDDQGRPVGPTALLAVLDPGHGAAGRSLLGRTRETAELLLEHGADPNLAGYDGRTPLLVLAGWKAGGAELTRLLLEHGADPDKPDPYVRRTPLVLAVLADNEPVVRALLKGKADPNVRTDVGHTALWFACDRGNVTVARALLEATADPNLAPAKTEGGVVPVSDGDTALHRAVRVGGVELVKLLLRYQADRKAVNAEGKTALDVARMLGNKDVIDLLDR
jgi:ankyrin repeat protein